MVERVEASFVTTTSHGSWLPGDVRGYVEHGQTLPPSPALESYAKQQMKTAVVNFSRTERDALYASLIDAAMEFEYRLSDVVVEATHLHWIIWHPDTMEAMVGRLKNRMRQRLARGRIWTAGYCGSELRSLRALRQAREYMARHDGLYLLAGNKTNRD